MNLKTRLLVFFLMGIPTIFYLTFRNYLHGDIIYSGQMSADDVTTDYDLQNEKDNTLDNIVVVTLPTPPAPPDVTYLILPNRKKFDCRKLFHGDQVEIKRAKNYRRQFPYPKVPEPSFVIATQKCDHFKDIRGYVTEISETEREFPLAYSIVLHTMVDQFERLLRAIYRPNNYYCLHVDKKADLQYFNAVKAIADCFDNVFIVSSREDMVYPGFTRLQPDARCMSELINRTKDWKYLLSLAGTEFPLKSNSELVQILSLYNGINILGKKVFVYRNDSTKASINHPPSLDLSTAKGSAYYILTREYVDYFLRDPSSRSFVESNHQAYSPDQHLWFNSDADSKHSAQVMSRAILVGSENCHGKKVQAVCEFGVGDLPWLKARSEFIASQFSLHADDVTVVCMEELLQQRGTVVRPESGTPSLEKPWDLDIHKEFVKRHTNDSVFISV